MKNDIKQLIESGISIDEIAEHVLCENTNLMRLKTVYKDIPDNLHKLKPGDLVSLDDSEDLSTNFKYKRYVVIKNPANNKDVLLFDKANNSLLTIKGADIKVKFRGYQPVTSSTEKLVTKVLNDKNFKTRLQEFGKKHGPE